MEKRLKEKIKDDLNLEIGVTIPDTNNADFQKLF